LIDINNVLKSEKNIRCKIVFVFRLFVAQAEHKIYKLYSDRIIKDRNKKEKKIIKNRTEAITTSRFGLFIISTAGPTSKT